jgi:hypothetical protein
MRLGAAAMLLAGVTALLTIGTLGATIYLRDQKLALVALGLLGITLLLIVLYRIFASSAHCPLCRAPVLGGSGAQRNRRAGRIFGSHRLRVASNIILNNTFVCPYCHEATRCVVKDRHLRGGGSRRRG